MLRAQGTDDILSLVIIEQPSVNGSEVKDG
jgi:hypothetical protein